MELGKDCPKEIKKAGKAAFRSNLELDRRTR